MFHSTPLRYTIPILTISWSKIIFSLIPLCLTYSPTCFLVVFKNSNDEEEFIIPNRPRQQALQLVFLSTQVIRAYNISLLSTRLQPLGAVQLYSCPQIVELRRSVWQDRVVLVHTITSGLNFASVVIHLVKTFVERLTLCPLLSQTASADPSSFMPEVFANRTACSQLSTLVGLGLCSARSSGSADGRM